MRKLMIISMLCLSGMLFSQTTRFVVVDWDTITDRTVDKISPSMIVNYNYQSASLPVGLDPDLELFVYQGEESNPVDYRLYELQNEYYFIDSLDDLWTENRICGLQSIATYRDSTDLYESIQGVKAVKNAKSLELQDQIEYLLFYIAYLDKVMNNQAIPPRLQNQLVPKFRQVAENWYMNYINEQNMIEAIRNDQPIDIDSGWSE